MKFDDIKKTVMPVLTNKKFQWAVTIALFLFVMMVSVNIRLSNWESLTDSTTGEKIPLALDPYYFLRIAETIARTDGNLPEYDKMRAVGFNVDWSSEIMPNVVVWMWKVANMFGEYSLQTVNVFSPVFFYVIGLILFFFLVYALTKSKFAGLLSSTFLAFIPTYLYRTMAGFSDHESIGMVGFFSAMLVFVMAMKYIDKTKKTKIIKSSFWGILVGLFTIITVLTWGGVATFLFMIIPISFLALWIVKLRNVESKFKNTGFIFYLSWIFSTIIFNLFTTISTNFFIGRYLSGTTGIFGIVTFGFILIDRLIMQFGKKIKKYNEKYRIYYTLIITVVAGIALLPIIKQNFFSLAWTILNKMLNPSWITGGGDGGRTGFTVAENAQPYLVNWISTAGTQIFWLFVAGMIIVGVELARNIKHKKNKAILVAGFSSMVLGILFSRISATSILNGEGIFSLSGLFYLGGLGFFVYAFFKNYMHNSLKVDATTIILAVWVFVILITGRSTTRLFFVIAPFMSVCAAYFILKMFKYSKSKKLEEISRVVVIGILLISIVAGSISIYNSHNTIASQAKYTRPSANIQWQRAMSWVRENTSEMAVFSHWWDYGYWIQTLGERPTMADGGHIQTKYNGNHKIGRYVLTTPKPETALSFFKTMDVDYLLIDQTDLGKYPAYSKIGSGIDGTDRYSAIPIMVADDSQARETANGTMIVFSGGTYLFEDITYNNGDRNIYLPARRAAVLGVVINIEDGRITQPEGVYMYNNIQTRIPLRYVYYNGDIIDFKTGLDVIIDLIPAFTGNGINPLGAAIYLSQKVSKSLFARLFLMDDVFNEYETIKLIHTEDDQVIASLKAQGVSLGNFIYYQGFRGPIKIWNTEEIPGDIKVVEEFNEPFNGYGALDELKFIE